MSRRGPTEGMVRIGQGGDSMEVLIRGAKALSRGIHGDIVAGCDCGSVLPDKLALSSCFRLAFDKGSSFLSSLLFGLYRRWVSQVCYAVRLLPKNQWPASTATVLITEEDVQEASLEDPDEGGSSGDSEQGNGDSMPALQVPTQVCLPRKKAIPADIKLFWTERSECIPSGRCVQTVSEAWHQC